MHIMVPFIRKKIMSSNTRKTERKYTKIYRMVYIRGEIISDFYFCVYFMVSKLSMQCILNQLVLFNSNACVYKTKCGMKRNPGLVPLHRNTINSFFLHHSRDSIVQELCVWCLCVYSHSFLHKQKKTKNTALYFTFSFSSTSADHSILIYSYLILF